MYVKKCLEVSEIELKLLHIIHTKKVRTCFLH